MNLNALRLFNQVAHRGSFSGAAASVRISQPAVSKTIAELEDSIGLRLFDRSRRPLTLTPAGVELFRHAQTIFTAERDAHLALADLREPISRHVHVAASAVLAEHVLPTIIARFIRDNPEVVVQLTVGNLHKVASTLGAAVADIAIIEGLLPGFEHLSTIPWRTQTLELYAPADHPIARTGQPVSLADLSGEPFVLRESGSATLGYVSQLLSEADVTLSSYVEAPSTAMMVALAAEGAGMTIAPMYAAAGAVHGGSLIPIDVKGAPFTRVTMHAVVETGSIRPEVAQFRHALESKC